MLKPEVAELSSFLLYALSIAVAFRYSKTLQVKDDKMRPYRWGYFLGFVSLISPANDLLLYFSDVPEDQKIVIFGFWGMVNSAVTVAIGLGVFLRLRLGWWALLASAIVSSIFVVRSLKTNPYIQENYANESLVGPYWFLAIAFAMFLVLNIVYARRRWHEFKPVRQSFEWN